MSLSTPSGRRLIKRFSVGIFVGGNRQEQQYVAADCIGRYHISTRRVIGQGMLPTMI
jgi:hypothetical protein